ncbi:DUF4136 domain-containing protein [Sphingobium aquiterrae]|uniref:DUF4136 domain-containing protein n=1 Tax=Sphingobium aquiterrae TaxID=2038656 RepID=UPI00301974AD
MSVSSLSSHRPLLVALAALALPLAGCATAVPPVEVTRFHTGAPATSGTFTVEEMIGNPDVSLEFRTYAAAVSQQLQAVGFSAGDAKSSDVIASVAFRRGFRPSGIDRSGKPVSVGVGGSTGSYGSGLGIGIGINLSGKPKDIVSTEMSVRIKRRSDGAVIWEGRALTEAKEGTPASQPGLVAGKLAQALFKDYPGQSGQTIRVK